MSQNPVSESSHAECSVSEDKPFDLFGLSSEMDDTRVDTACADEDTSQSPAFSLVLADDDESATEDLILCESPANAIEMTEQEATAADEKLAVDSSSDREPSAEYDKTLSPLIHRDSERGRQQKSSRKPMPDLPPRGEIAKLGTRRPGTIPSRIGKGKLVPANLSWKPGDPFGKGGTSSKARFRWELMLTTACLTGACGLVGIWLLRSIFA